MIRNDNAIPDLTKFFDTPIKRMGVYEYLLSRLQRHVLMGGDNPSMYRFYICEVIRDVYFSGQPIAEAVLQICNILPELALFNGVMGETDFGDKYGFSPMELYSLRTVPLNVFLDNDQRELVLQICIEMCKTK